MERRKIDLSKITQNQIEAFWLKVQKTDHCWLWLGYTDEDGYGSIGINRTTFLAHRVAWVISGNPDIEKCLLHSCDNPTCVNPAHLREGARGDNNKERAMRGRSAKGEKHGRAKLTESDVLQIRKDFQLKSLSALAKEYDVSKATIGRVVHRVLWKHI